MFTLQYPAGQSSGAITIRNPEMGDGLQIHDGKQINRTRSGEINSVYNDWPQIRVRVYNFTTLTKTKMEEVRLFLIATAGFKIGIITHLNEVLSGYITTPVTDIITIKDNCSYSLSFEFEEDGQVGE